MIRRVLGKVMWLGRATSALVGLVVLFALGVGAANSALAHTTVDNKLFHLGHSNPATAPTSLVSTLADAAKSALIVQNKSGGAALDLRVGNATTQANDVAPMKVNSTKKVAKLNADRIDDREASSFANGVNGVATDADELDGQDSAAFQKRVSGQCAEGSSIRSIGADGATVTCEQDDDTSAAQVNQLRTELGTNDGTPNESSDPVSYTKLKDVPADAVNRNADTLDGQNSSDFAPANHDHDSRYYTEPEVNTALSGKANTIHPHSGADVTSGTVAEARIDGAVARDNEVMNIAKATDGAGSGLDADRLDGLNSTDLTVGMAAASGLGNNPGTTVSFLATPVQVTVAAGQGVHVNSTKAFGSTVAGGGLSLNLAICSRPAATPTATPFGYGDAVLGLRVNQNERTTMGLSWVITGLPAGAYQVGLCGWSTQPETWNSNEYGYTTAMIVKPSVGTASSLAQQSQQSDDMRTSEQSK